MPLLPRTKSWFERSNALSGLEEPVPRPLKPRLFIHGNSLMVSGGATPPLFPARIFTAVGTKWETSSVGRGGWSTMQLFNVSTMPGGDLAALNTDDEKNNRKRRVICLYEATNDIGIGPAYAASNYERYSRVRIDEGWTMVLYTLCPTIGINEAYRLEFNDLIRANYKSWGVTTIIDIGADAQMQNPNDVNIYIDGVHLNVNGHQRFADVSVPVIESLYLAPP